MADVVDTRTRSRMMAGIRGKDTQPEMIVRRFLHRHGFRFRLHVTDLPGRPDIVLPKYSAAIQVRGCFWHQHAGCRYATRPATNALFWREKLDGNAHRDREKDAALLALGWHVYTVWECELSDAALGELATDIASRGASRPNRMNLSPRLGVRLMKVRRQKKISRRELEYRSGVDEKTLTAIERGELLPKAAVAIRLAMALGLNGRAFEGY